jgi:hypothetical protein
MTAKLKTISYVELVNDLLANLPEREREVLQKRNSLGDFPKYTLEQIGKDFNITRERVRQIEREGLKKIKSLDFNKVKLPFKDLENAVIDFLKNHGGAMAEWHLSEKLLKEQKADEEKALAFILSNILAEKIKRIADLDQYHEIWALTGVDLDETLTLAEALKELIAKHGNPLAINDLHDKFKSHELYAKLDNREGDNLVILEALLGLRKDLDVNILGQWGFNDWQTITPKRMTDKAYLIMLREGKPLHFVEVTDLINQANFDRKKAHPATVHNELILDDKYVLVGRGIYALKEWGYKEGTVADIISEVLKAKGPLDKKDITDEVLKQRMVQKTTITLVLMNKDRFVRQEDGRYNLV